MKRIFDIDSWHVRSHTLEKEDKRLQESLTSIGNGYMGMRGYFEERYSGDTHLGTYIAGVWYPDKTRVGWWKNGYPHYFGKVINATNFIAVDIEVNGQDLDLAVDTIEDFVLDLDMKNGILTREFTLIRSDATVRFTFERFLSVAQKELAIVKVSASVLSGDQVSIKMVSKLDGNVRNEDSNYDEQFWQAVSFGKEPLYIQTQTVENPFEAPRFTVLTAMHNEWSHEPQTEDVQEFLARQSVQVSLSVQESLTLTKYVAVVTSRDVEVDKQCEVANHLLQEATQLGFDALKNAHQKVWESRWQKADVDIFGDDEAQQGIRFNIFQLFSTYYGEDYRLNVGPKGFTGEKYGGATYWDTEAYIVPMYLSVADEQVTKELLMYRHNQLDGAIHNAKQQGLKGALYPMVTFTGVECHNEWEITFEEIHRNGAIAYAIYNYTNYTGNSEYVLTKGIDVLVGISRFWADRVHFSKRHQQYMIHGVTGPNEYENNVNNNYHTNNIAKWTLMYTCQILKDISHDKRVELDITEQEIGQWEHIIANMYLPYDEELGIFVQHDTFLDKDLQPVSALSPEDRPLNQKWSWDKILRSPYIKQADVLQSIYFFNDMYTQEEKERHFNFYEPLTVHESSLSPCIHSILAAELGKEDKAVELYARTARLDLDNYNNDTEDGLHITSMSGSWLSIVQGFAGMRVYHGKLIFNPFVPKQWEGYTFKINFRERLLSVHVTKEEAVVTLISGESLTIQIAQHMYQLQDKVVVSL
ncbi:MULTISPECIES: glycoside hydrolase family 65 protein [unclassified Granulicatella]|uniref:glycoside hydrolase family 65 protein n=1 Tax=unclassified Granulicatella TaxID=2630493 RepID=UPI001072F88A|nr:MULTISPECIES: glycoside hydrolase family 65 protein [unclassified Granulicatella]MBF0779658.1 glycoside hydrolase family 65 protein [Granulicatella sp. 19428wC4_WM01]TFU96314.1 glycoside hydrolase family 65 protein [Granulicatella sp. WM01]